PEDPRQPRHLPDAGVSLSLKVGPASRARRTYRWQVRGHCLRSPVASKHADSSSKKCLQGPDAGGYPWVTPFPEKPMPETPLSLLHRLGQPEVQSADWDRLVAVYSPLLRNWLGRYPLQGADADDLVQEVLTVLVKKLPQFHHAGKQGS